MIAGIEAFRRRRSAFVPLSPSVPQPMGTRKANRDGLSPMSPLSPHENTLPANKTNDTATVTHREPLVQANDVADDAPPEWLTTLLGRVDICDALINQLCGLRNDTDKERADLLKTRRNAARAFCCLEELKPCAAVSFNKCANSVQGFRGLEALPAAAACL